ncbi:MAG: acyltransferase [Bacteroidales bacterium]|nr:acyltransferase [Candidatus Colimorpha merdihippi]
MTSQTGRIEYIDLAKGICILLVVVFHLTEYYGYPCVFNNYGRVFRMPLYYFLSGVFFKTYGGFVEFVKRKTNKLLIPFVFWYIFSVSLSIILFLSLGWKIPRAHRFDPIHAMMQIFVYHEYPNLAIWFLLSLFEVNIIFYVVSIIANKCGRYKLWILAALSLMCGGVGCYLISTGLELPLFMHKTLYYMPHFCLGYFVFRHTNLLHANISDKYAIVYAIIGFVCFWAVARFGLSLNDPNMRISSLRQLIIAYPGACLGIFGILMISKAVKKVPVLSMYGRYSIMILVTHVLLICIFIMLTDQFHIPEKISFIMCTIVLMTYGLVLIPFMRRFMPHVTAQKDVIKVKNVG